jgi:catechol 2,3-dioxygenase-like lactoylglutathione lyase family enzyme
MSHAHISNAQVSNDRVQETHLSEANFVILYVQDPPASADFYSTLLGRPVVERAPTFAMLPLCKGVMLGLWSKHTVEPRAEATGGGAEIAITMASADEVRATHDDWRKRHLNIAQAPVEMEFGTTFVALDPDGHRIRVFAPGQA